MSLILTEEFLWVYVPQATAKLNGFMASGQVLLGHIPILVSALPAIMADVLIGPSVVDGYRGKHPGEFLHDWLRRVQAVRKKSRPSETSALLAFHLVPQF